MEITLPGGTLHCHARPVKRWHTAGAAPALPSSHHQHSSRRPLGAMYSGGNDGPGQLSP
jgi:hypothetical protein